MEDDLKFINFKEFILYYVFIELRKQNRQERSGLSASHFRSHLSSMGFNGFITYPSFNHFVLEACTQDRIEKLSNTIDSLNPFEEKRDYFATSVLSESENLQFDTEGRVLFSKITEPCKN